jgi:hypothetical protein
MQRLQAVRVPALQLYPAKRPIDATEMTKWLAALMELRYAAHGRVQCFAPGGRALRPAGDLQDMMGDPGKIIPA